MSDSVDALLGGEEDVGDYDIKDDEEDALLEDDDEVSRNDETKDVLDLGIDDTLNEEDDTELSDTEGRAKFLSERQSEESSNSKSSYTYHNNYNKQYKYINNNINNRGRGMRGSFRGYPRGHRGNIRNKTFTPRFEGGPNKLFINPHFKGNTHINHNNTHWEQKPALSHIWINKQQQQHQQQQQQQHHQQQQQQQPMNNFPTQPIMPVNNFHSRPVAPQIQHQLMHKPPVHQRLGMNNPPFTQHQGNNNYEADNFSMGMNHMQQPPPVVNAHTNQFNMPPAYNQPPPMYQPPVNNMPSYNHYQQPQQDIYQQYAQPAQPLIQNTPPPPIFTQPPPQIYSNDNSQYNTFAPPPQVQQYNVNENNYNQNYNNNYQQSAALLPPQQQQQQRYHQNDTAISPVINRQVFYKNQPPFGKRRNERRSESVDDYGVNKRRSYENKVLHQVQTVETTSSTSTNNTPITTTYQVTPEPEVVEDEETKKYREKIEEQKRLRERLLAQKEERRKIAAKKKLAEEEYATVISPKEILKAVVAPTIKAAVHPQRKLTESYHANPNLKIINATDDGNENKVDKGQLKSFLSNRTIFAKDQSLVDTSLVVVSNLAAGTSEVKLRKMCEGLGDIQKIDLSTKERQATIHFKSVASAHAFYKKYQRYMLDLSVIQVALKTVE